MASSSGELADRDVCMFKGAVMISPEFTLLVCANRTFGNFKGDAGPVDWKIHEHHPDFIAIAFFQALHDFRRGLAVGALIVGEFDYLHRCKHGNLYWGTHLYR